MRLLVRRGHSLINDLRFETGPVYIGRIPQSQVFLPDRSVSRRHAVLFTTANGTWTAQDLDSANRTTLNGRPIAKMPLHEGDVIGIADFMLEIHFEPDAVMQADEQPLDLGDTIVDGQAALASIYHTTRRQDQPIHLPSGRLKDFYHLTKVLGGTRDQDALLPELNKLLLEQFNAYHAWAGLRETESGPLTCHGGSSRGGGLVKLEHLVGRNIVKQAIQDETYILLPNVADLFNSSDTRPAGLAQLRSVMVVPIVAPAGTYGVIYVDNGIDQEPYTRQDLDYLTLVSIELAAIVEHIG